MESVAGSVGVQNHVTRPCDMLVSAGGDAVRRGGQRQGVSGQRQACPGEEDGVGSGGRLVTRPPPFVSILEAL